MLLKKNGNETVTVRLPRDWFDDRQLYVHYRRNQTVQSLPIRLEEKSPPAKMIPVRNNET